MSSCLHSDGLAAGHLGVSDAHWTACIAHRASWCNNAIRINELFLSTNILEISPVRDWRLTSTYCQLQSHVPQKLGAKNQKPGPVTL